MRYRWFEIFGYIGRGPLWCLCLSVLVQLVPWVSLGIPPTIVSDLLIFIAFGWGGYRALVNKQLAAFTTWPMLVAGAGMAFAVLSALTSPHPLAAVISLGRLAEAFVVIPLTCLLVIRKQGDLVLFLTSFMVLGTVQGISGIMQYVTKTGALYQGDYIRAVGTWGAAQIGVLSAISVMCLAIAVAFTMATTGTWRVLGVALVAINVLATLAGLSRAAWIASALVIGVQLTRFDLRRTVMVVIGGAAALGLGIAVASSTSSVLGDRLLSLTTASASASEAVDQSQLDRLSLWQGAMQMIDDNPLFGIGPREFPHERDVYAPLSLLGSSDIGDYGTFSRQEILSPHNLYLLLTAEYGIPAGVLILSIIPVAMIAGIGRSQLSPRSNALATTCGLASSGILISIIAGGLFGDLGGAGTLVIGWGLGLAVWWSAHTAKTLAPPHRREKSRDEALGLDGVPWWRREWARPVVTTTAPDNA